jgi:hypothetical protein
LHELKISFPKYSSGELLIKERATPCITSLAIIGFLACLCGSYLLHNKFWFLTIALVGIVGILLWLRKAAGVFLTSIKVDRLPSANIEENVPRITSQWDYRPKKPIRARAGCDSPSPETSEVLTPEPFGIDNSVWSNDNSLEATAPSFINAQLDAEELMPKVLSETTDPVCTTTVVNNPAVWAYD